MRLQTTCLAASVTALFFAVVCGAQPHFISPAGDDANLGTRGKPFAPPQRAQQAVREKRGDVFLRGGTYYLAAPLVFTAEDSGTAAASIARFGITWIFARPVNRSVRSGGLPPISFRHAILKRLPAPNPTTAFCSATSPSSRQNLSSRAVAPHPPLSARDVPYGVAARPVGWASQPHIS